MTMRIGYRLVPESRMSAGRSGQVGNSRDVHRLIPGATIRGALGHAWWTSPTARFTGEDGEKRFAQLFHAAMSVGTAVPEWRTTDSDWSVSLIPMSYVACKYPQSGCTTPAGETVWHDRAASDRHRCPTCSGPLVAGRGWTEGQVPTVLTTRTALEQGLAKTSHLFTRRAVEMAVEYAGYLTLDEAVGGADEAVSWLLRDKVIFVGGQRTTMGRCRWTARVTADSASEARTPPVLPVLIVLRSAAILVDRMGLPSLDLIQGIRDSAQRAGGNVTVSDQTWTRPSVIGGWNSVAGIPKPEEWALDAGSCALVTAMDHTAYEALRAGIGVRRREGYGEVQFVPVGATSESIRVAVPLPRSKDDDEQARIGLLDTLDAGSLRGMLEAARHVQRLRDGGLGESAVAQHVERTLGLPWCRDLGPTSQAEVGQQLRGDVRELIELLAARIRLTGGGR